MLTLPSCLIRIVDTNYLIRILFWMVTNVIVRTWPDISHVLIFDTEKTELGDDVFKCNKLCLTLSMNQNY